MAVVLGKNFTVYLGDSMNTIGCEDSCTVNVTAAEIITTTKGSGRGTNREYGSYDATLTSTGVVFPYESETAAAAADKTDVTFLHSYLLQGKKVCAKYQLTDGSTTKYAIANWIIRSVTFTGAAEGAMTFDLELALDGKIYETANMTSSAVYDGPSVYVYTEDTTPSDSFTFSGFEDASAVYFIIKNGVIQENVTFTNGGGVPIDPTEVNFDYSDGTIYFGTPLASGDVIIVSYDSAD